MSRVESLLLPLLSWLERACRRATATRHGLEDGELFNEVVARFIDREPAWFSQPAHTSEQAQALALLRYLIRHVTTEWDREQLRRAPGIPLEEDGAPPLADQLAALLTPVEEELMAQQQDEQVREAIHASIQQLPNPVFRLLLRGVYLPQTVQKQHFEEASRHSLGGAQPLLRGLNEAWLLFEDARQHSSPGEEEWKIQVAEILRCRGALGHSDADELSRARGWLDRTLHRARQLLSEHLRAPETEP